MPGTDEELDAALASLAEKAHEFEDGADTASEGDAPEEDLAAAVPAASRWWIWVAVAVAVVAVAGAALWFLTLGRSVKVPSLVGADRSGAAASLRAVGLKLGRVTVTDSDEASGTVVSQSPAAGADLRIGRPVDIAVSSGVQFVAMPDLSGKTPDEAKAAIEAAGLRLFTLDVVGATASTGSVVGQVPAAGSRVPKRARVAVAVPATAGPSAARVPDVNGMTADDAAEILRRQGLYMVGYEAFDAQVASGSVSQQFPPAGADVVGGTAVAVLVSMGPPSGASDAVPVPDAGETSVEDGRDRIRAAGMDVRIYSTFDPDVRKGDVLGQVPAPGTQVAVGTIVGIGVSLGPAPATVTVPDLTGMRAGEASAAIDALGLLPFSCPMASGTVPEGAVVQQMPAAGSSVTPGTALAFAVSRGREAP